MRKLEELAATYHALDGAVDQTGVKGYLHQQGHAPATSIQTPAYATVNAILVSDPHPTVRNMLDSVNSVETRTVQHRHIQGGIPAAKLGHITPNEAGSSEYDGILVRDSDGYHLVDGQIRHAHETARKRSGKFIILTAAAPS